MLERQLGNLEIDAATYRARYLRIRSFREKVAAELEQDLETRREDRSKVFESTTRGPATDKLEESLDTNIEKLEELAEASRKLAPPAVDLTST